MQGDVLGNFLIDSGLLSRTQVADALERADGRPLSVVLVESGVLSEDEVRKAQAHALGVPFVTLTKLDLDTHALMLIPEPLSRAHGVVAYKLEGGELEVAMLDLSSLEALSFLAPRYRVRPRLISRRAFKEALINYQKILKEKFSAGFRHPDTARATGALLSHAALSRASDIHLMPGARMGEYSVRYRIYGALHDAMTLPKMAVIANLKDLADLSPTLHVPQEGEFESELNGALYRVRVASLPTPTGEKVTLRLLSLAEGRTGFSLEALGFHGASLDYVHQLLQKTRGLIAVAGPALSGKSTTLYTLIDLAQASHRALATVEDKIEHRLPYALQTEVSKTVGISQAQALRATLRADNDVVMIGEVASEEVATLAREASNRHTLIFAGLTDPALLDHLQPDALISQRLLKKLCRHCREGHTISRAEERALEELANFGRVLSALKEEGVVESFAAWKELTFYRASGCGKCEGGYKGYVGVQEILTPTESPTLNLIEDALFKAARGQTSIE